MKQIIIKPEVEQKTKWRIIWSIIFFPIAIGLSTLIYFIRYPESVAIVTMLVMFLLAAAIVLFWIPPFHRSSFTVSLMIHYRN